MRDPPVLVLALGGVCRALALASPFPYPAVLGGGQSTKGGKVGRPVTQLATNTSSSGGGAAIERVLSRIASDASRFLPGDGGAGASVELRVAYARGISALVSLAGERSARHLGVVLSWAVAQCAAESEGAWLVLGEMEEGKEEEEEEEKEGEGAQGEEPSSLFKPRYGPNYDEWTFAAAWKEGGALSSPTSSSPLASSSRGRLIFASLSLLLACVRACRIRCSSRRHRAVVVSAAARAAMCAALSLRGSGSGRSRSRKKKQTKKKEEEGVGIDLASCPVFGLASTLLSELDEGVREAQTFEQASRPKEGEGGRGSSWVVAALAAMAAAGPKNAARSATMISTSKAEDEVAQATDGESVAHALAILARSVA